MRRILLLLALLVVPGWGQGPLLPNVLQAVARPTPSPTEQKAWLEGLGYEVDASGASMEHDPGPTVVLWAKDTPVARLAIAGMAHLKRHWRGTLKVRLGDPGPEPDPTPRLIVRARIGDSLSPTQVAVPRSDFRAHLDVVEIDVPAAPGTDQGVACAEILLALRTEMADPLEDLVLNVEKFTVGHIVVSLKTYDLGSRNRGMEKLQKLVKQAAPQALLKLPREEQHEIAPIDWSFRLRQALAREIGADRLQLEAPIEEDSRYQETSLAWNCPAVAVWVGRKDDQRQSAAAIVLTLLEAFRG